jgi:hypothetical protein
MRTATIEEMKRHAPSYKRREVKPPGDNLMVIPQADVHIGKWCDVPETGNVYNTEQAVKRCRDGTDALVAKGMAFGVKAFVLCVGNDILHIDTPKRTSTAGTPQDTDGTIFTMYQAAKKLYITMIEQLALVADVHLVFVPSNHDWVSGYMLADSVGSWFHKHPNVHLGDGWQNLYARHRKYVHFGHNLIMFTHGDGAKEKDLHWHLATEAAEVWSKTRFRYVYTGHIHHKVRKVKGYGNAQIEKDHVGFTEISGFDREPTRNVHIEYVRSQSPADGWHDRNGYTNQPACEAFLHHPTEGQFARFTHYY